MGGVNTTQLLASTGDPIEQPVLVRGYVSTIRAAPVSFGEPVWVIVPGYSIDRPLGPCEWPAIHGASLPVQGAECVVGFDDQHVPTLVWWGGPRSIEPKPELVSVLPGSPVDGQEVYFQNTTLATEGVVWNLRYRAASSSSHKWEFVGGSAVFSEVFTAQATSSASFTDLATVGPSITTPLDGDYDAEFGARIVNAASGFGVIGIKVGGAEAGNGGLLNTGGASEANVMRGLRLTGLTAGELLKTQYKTTSTSSEFLQRFLYVRPVRVG